MTEHEDKLYRLIVNKKPKTWPSEFITGAQIKALAESPSDWVVNEVVPGAGEDPEIGDGQQVDLSEKTSPQGIKKFTTRKPTTSPGR
jgi:Multiubiquitin